MVTWNFFRAFRKHNITLFGTSNSLMKQGWFDQSKTMPARSGLFFTSLCLGGVSSCFGLFRLVRDFPETADTILLDYCLNDLRSVQIGRRTTEDLLGNHAAMLAELHRHNALDKTLILMFPIQHQMEPGGSSDLFDRLIRLFNGYGVDYIDFRPVVRKWMTDNSVSAADTYSDMPTHFVPDCQKAIAAVVLAALHKRRRSATLRSKAVLLARSRLAQLQPVGLRRLEVKRAAPAECRSEGTSLIREQVHCLAPGEVIRISGAPLLLAIFFWTHDNSGVLTFRGTVPPRRYHLRRSYKKIFMFEAFEKPLVLKQVARVENINDLKVAHKSMIMQQSSIYDSSDSFSEVVDFIGCDRDPADFGVDAEAVLSEIGFSASDTRQARPNRISAA